MDTHVCVEEEEKKCTPQELVAHVLATLPAKSVDVGVSSGDHEVEALEWKISSAAVKTQSEGEKSPAHILHPRCR